MTAALDLERLRRLLGGPELEWLVARVRRRMAQGEPLTVTVTLGSATDEQRRAVARLLGRPPRSGAGLSVSLNAVDEVLRQSGACPDGLAMAIRALTGEVPDLLAARAASERAWREAFVPLDELAARHPEYAAWRAGLVGTGLVRRLAGTADAARRLLADTATVLDRLPAAGEPIGVFAARILHQAHGLDDDRPLATLVLGAVRFGAGLPDGAGAEWRREVWASVGLLRDELSCTVLTLGLPGDTRTGTGRALAACRETGQPMVVTLRQLVRDPPAVTGGQLSICENPAVVSVAASRLGPGCRPLICTGGQPSAAVLYLLRLYLTAGATPRYHGDFDWGGLRIANGLFSRFPMMSWRFDTASYLATAAGRPLAGQPVEACWDPDLGPAMRDRALAVEEETVVDDLIDDLA